MQYYDRVIEYLRFHLASLRVKLHWMVVWSRLMRRFQARACWRNPAMLPILRLPRHSRLNMLISISAWFSQLPQPITSLLSEPIHQRPAAMRGEIVQHHVDGRGGGIAFGDLQQEVGELRRRARGRRLRRTATFVIHSRVAQLAQAASQWEAAFSCNTTGFSSRQTTAASSVSGFSVGMGSCFQSPHKYLGRGVVLLQVLAQSSHL
jgi:hypothetical protein